VAEKTHHPQPNKEKPKSDWRRFRAESC